MAIFTSDWKFTIQDGASPANTCRLLLTLPTLGSSDISDGKFVAKKDLGMIVPTQGGAGFGRNAASSLDNDVLLSTDGQTSGLVLVKICGTITHTAYDSGVGTLGQSWAQGMQAGAISWIYGWSDSSSGGSASNDGSAGDSAVASSDSGGDASSDGGSADA
jgi:hypothetical protein